MPDCVVMLMHIKGHNLVPAVALQSRSGDRLCMVGRIYMRQSHMRQSVSDVRGYVSGYICASSI